MELFYIVLAISVPVFYLWGLFAFIQTVFGNKEPKQSRSERDKKEWFVEYFFERIEDAPEMTLQDFLDEVRIVRKREMNAGTAPQVESLSTAASQVADASLTTDETESETTFADLVSNMTPPSEPAPPTFSWSEWYADHSIDFILYLGAFMIVAAVSLFVGFQWESFDSMTRFGIVVAFTASWYIAGVAVQRILSLDSVAIAFMTIGAIITPFCGVAWQRFVIGSMENFGITWLITSIIGTAIYIVLSLIYQRRHFTYFGNLSILATVLSLVEITASPAEFYVLAGTATAIILLAGRFAVKTLAPRVDAYLGQDIEYSSLAILLFSVIAGIILIPLTELPVLSIEVLAVMIATLVYACAYLTLHFNRYTIVIAQSLGILTFSHALLTFNVDYRIALYIVLIASIGLQFILNNWLEERYPEIFAASNVVGLLISSIVYALSIILAEGAFLAIPAILMLIGHAAYYAIRLDNPYAWYLVSILSYPLLTHILLWLKIDYDYWTSTFVILSAIQLVPIMMTLKKEIIQAFVYPALIVGGFAGAVSLTIASPLNSPDALTFLINIINPFIVLIAYALVMFADREGDEGIFNQFVPVILASVSILYALSSAGNELTFVTILLSLSASVLFYLAYRLTELPYLYYVVFSAPYVALYNSLFVLDVAPEIYPISFAILSGIIYFALFLPEETDVPRQVVAILATAGVAAVTFSVAIYEEPLSMHFAGWVSAYTSLFMLWKSRTLLGREVGDVVFSVAVFFLYAWHINFLQVYIESTVFNDPQWYSAALASILLIHMIKLTGYDEDNPTRITFLQLGAAAVLMLPTLGQIVYEQSLLYFALGVIYSLVLGAVAITFSQARMRTIAAISLVLVVLSQSSEFLLNLPRWIVIGVIGFSLIGAGLYLSIRRRNVKKQID